MGLTSNPREMMGKTLVPHQQVKCQGQKCPTQKSVSHCISCSTWLPALLNIKDVELQKQTGITVWTSKSQLWEAGLAHKLPELSDLRTQHRNNPFLPLQQILSPSTPHFASRVSPRKQTQYLHWFPSTRTGVRWVRCSPQVPRLRGCQKTQQSR